MMKLTEIEGNGYGFSSVNNAKT